ncbi:hypothetical protein GFS31_07120 [Leptolyngbya sp. BL0902]|uniref:hypothetical protein n=1 Tax=Leptolyngbya sp. BL0902 TaxID=1115757 RepID=UPI0018E7545B|nr:hypothetical protein [Leptolyngbya sp. BL0902]QQE64040.1 hypothetical protein GFS31_07120 [Leptolyngbya sp. BL0902]
MSSFNADLLNRDYEVKIGEYFGRGWAIFKEFAWGYILFTLVIGIISGLLSQLPSPLGMRAPEGELGGGNLLFSIISPALGAGFYFVSFQIARNRPKNFSDFFGGFKKFLPLFLTSLVSGILIFLGLIALVIPGIYLAVAYMFAQLFVIDKNMSFWSAMETSRKLISKRWFSFLILSFALGLLVLAGFLLLGVGALVTIPLSTCVLAAAYEDIVGLNSVSEESSWS